MMDLGERKASRVTFQFLAVAAGCLVVPFTEVGKRQFAFAWSFIQGTGTQQFSSGLVKFEVTRRPGNQTAEAAGHK